MSAQDEKAASSPKPFEVTGEELNGVRVIAVSGELDLNTAPQLEERLEAALAAGDSGLLIDLSRCEFIDSTGIGLIVRAWQRLDTRFALCGLSDQVGRLLEITGLDSSIQAHRSRDEALGALRGD
jgi:anti-sigma B factor antagonist